MCVGVDRAVRREGRMGEKGFWRRWRSTVDEGRDMIGRACVWPSRVFKAALAGMKRGLL